MRKMMKSGILIAIAVLVFGSPAVSSEKPAGENQYVKFSAALKQPTMAKGSTGALLFMLRPQKGIHINLEPPVSVTFDSAGPVEPSGKVEVPKMAKHPYLDTAKAIVQRFKLAKRESGTTVSLRGILTYFYCSDAEGWCSKFRQPFELNLTVAK
jgi:hypothetical protein